MEEEEEGDPLAKELWVPPAVVMVVVAAEEAGTVLGWDVPM